MIGKLLLTVVLFFGATHPAYAEVVPEIQDFLKSELTKLNRVRVAVTDLEAGGEYGTAMSDYIFSAFWLRIRAEVGFDIEFGKLALIPEIELTWQ